MAPRDIPLKKGDCNIRFASTRNRYYTIYSIMSQKRKLDDSNSQACPGSRASELNVYIVKKL